MGFSLIELIWVMIIVALMASLALPRLSEGTRRALNAEAMGDIRTLSIELLEYRLANKVYPATLDEIGRGDMVDPWGKPYTYLPINERGKGYRKDRFLNPISSDFDLWSDGADGVTSASVNHRSSLDDVIRAADGAFIGVAEDF